MNNPENNPSDSIDYVGFFDKWKSQTTSFDLYRQTKAHEKLLALMCLHVLIDDVRLHITFELCVANVCDDIKN